MTESIISFLKDIDDLENVKKLLENKAYLEIAKYLYFKQNGQPLPNELKNLSQVTTYKTLSAVSGIPVNELEIKLGTQRGAIIFNQYMAEIEGHVVDGVELHEIGLRYLRESGLVTV